MSAATEIRNELASVKEELAQLKAALDTFFDTFSRDQYKKSHRSEFSPTFMPLPSPVGIRDADRPEQVFLPPGDRTEYGDLKFGAPECLPTVQEYLVPGWNEGGLGCNEPPIP